MHVRNPKTTVEFVKFPNEFGEKTHSQICENVVFENKSVSNYNRPIDRWKFSRNKTVKSIQKKRYYETIKKAGFRAEDKRAKFEMNGGLERGARGAKVAGAFEQSGGISGPLRFGLGIVARNGSGRKRRRG